MLFVFRCLFVSAAATCAAALFSYVGFHLYRHWITRDKLNQLLAEHNIHGPVGAILATPQAFLMRAWVIVLMVLVFGVTLYWQTR